MSVLTKTVAVNDITMAYSDHGAGDVPIVLVHGFTGARHDFRLVAEPLAADRSVIAVDQRGHGDSSKPADPSSYTFDQLVSDLTGFIDQVVDGPFHLLGHSMGGMICMRYALTQPAGLSSLILMDTSAESPQMPFDLEEDYIDKLFATAEQAGLAAAREMNTAAGGPERELIDSIHGPAFSNDDEDWRYERLDLFAVSRLGPRTFRHESVLDQLVQVTVPTTVMVGSRDTAFVEPSRRMAAVLSNATYHEIDGAFHSPQHSHTQQWLSIVQGHLAKVARS